MRRAFYLFSIPLLSLACGTSGSAPETEKDATAPDAHVAVDASSPPRDASAHDAGGDAALDAAPASACLPGMILIGTYCIDQYEAYVVEVLPDGGEQPHSPYDVIGDASVRAKVAGGVVPQAYISQIEATAACNAAGKRLCSATEFALGCRGPDAGNYYPYGGTVRMPGYCNEGKGSSMPLFFGNDPSTWTFADFNDPRLDEWDGGLAATGAYPRCVSPYGLYDCVGNLHEWGLDPADQNGNGRFRGGFYGDAELNGPGCLYVTSAHALAYHDYSTGFRCCADAIGSE